MILSHPYLDICSFLLTSRITGNVFLTIIIMPSLMLISSLNYYLHRFHRHKRSFRNCFSILFWGILTIFSLYRIISVTPFDNDNKQIVEIDEVINLNERSRSILISSQAPLGDVELQLDEQRLTLNDVGRHAEITAPMIENLLEIDEEKSSFLDRMSLKYRISAKGIPEIIKFNLSSQKSLIIFDSNFPYDVTADGKNINFYIGKNPLLPLELHLILPGGSKPEIKLAIQYKEFPYTFDLKGFFLEQDKTLTITKVIPWKE